MHSPEAVYLVQPQKHVLESCMCLVWPKPMHIPFRRTSGVAPCTSRYKPSIGWGLRKSLVDLV